MIENNETTTPEVKKDDKLSVKEKIFMSISFAIAIGLPFYIHLINQ